MKTIRLLEAPQQRSGIDQKIIPMINVIFLLLLFFLIAGSLSDLVREDIVPPRSSSSRVAAELDDEVLLSRDGSIVWRERELTLEALRDLLRQSPGELPRSLRLRADGRVQAVSLLPLMDLLRANGVERLVLVTINEA